MILKIYTNFLKYLKKYIDKYRIIFYFIDLSKCVYNSFVTLFSGWFITTSFRS